MGTEIIQQGREWQGVSVGARLPPADDEAAQAFASAARTEEHVAGLSPGLGVCSGHLDRRFRAIATVGTGEQPERDHRRDNVRGGQGNPSPGKQFFAVS